MKELQAVNQQVILDINDDKKEQKTKAGIIIPDSAKEKSNIAKVINMSKIDNAEVSVGDMVIYKGFSGNEITFEDNKYLILPYDDILAIIVETDEI